MRAAPPGFIGLTVQRPARLGGAFPGADDPGHAAVEADDGAQIVEDVRLVVVDRTIRIHALDVDDVELTRSLVDPMAPRLHRRDDADHEIIAHRFGRDDGVAVRHRQRRRPHLAHAAAPAGAEHRPGAQALQEGQPLVADRRDQDLRIAPAHRRDDLVGDRAGIVRQAEQPAQHLAGAADAGIHAVVEHRVIDAAGEIVAALNVPVFLAVDALGGLDRHRADVGGARVRVQIFAVVVDGDAEIGRPAGIGRMVAVAALVHEQALEGFVVVGGGHANSPCLPAGPRRALARLQNVRGATRPTDAS
jgi:hypothetical protein